jgi:hypothetical protein
MVVLWLGCRCCRSSVKTIVGRIMIELSLSFVSKHNMWSCYDWVVVVVFVSNNDNPIITRPHIVFTDGRQPNYNTTTYCVYWRRQRQPNHNTTTYCVYSRTTTTINPIIIRPHIVFTDGRQHRQPNHNTTTYCVNWRTTTTTTQS